MNKIIFISIIIFFAISSKSWAGEIDGKGLICEINQPEKYQNKPARFIVGFNNGHAFIPTLNKNSSQPKVNLVSEEYFLSKDSISFFSHKVNRKNLIMSCPYYKETTFSELGCYTDGKQEYICKVIKYSKEVLKDFYKEELKLLKEDLKKNKI